jgi:hypothetical protein
LINKGTQTCTGIGLAVQSKTTGYQNCRNKIRGDVRSTGNFAAAVSFGLSGCFFSSEKYGRGKLSYGIARPHSLEANSPIGKISKGNYAREIPSEFLWIERALICPSHVLAKATGKLLQNESRVV